MRSFGWLLRSPGHALPAAGSALVAVFLIRVVAPPIVAALAGPLPFPRADELAVLVVHRPEGSDTALLPDEMSRITSAAPARLSVARVERWPESYRGWAEVSDGLKTARTAAAYVTSNFFQVVGVQVATASAPTRGEEEIVISRGYVSPTGIAAGQLTGRWLRVNGSWLPVVGELPRSFAPPLAPTHDFLGAAGHVDMWIVEPAAIASRGFELLARVPAGERLATYARTLNSRMASLDPLFAANHRFDLEPIRAAMLGSNARAFQALAALALLAFLLAVANTTAVVALALEERTTALSTQLALGARRRHVIVPALVPVFILTGAGGLAGVAVGRVLGPALAPLLPALPWPPTAATTSSLSGCLAALLLSSLAVLIAALVAEAQRKAVLLAPSALFGALRSRRGNHSTLRFSILTVEALGLCLALPPAFALAQALWTASTARPFLRRPDVVVAETQILDSQYREAAELPGVYQRLRAEVLRIPDVTTVGLGSVMPVLNEGFANWIVGVDSAHGSRHLMTFGVQADATFVNLLGAQLLSGRAFDDEDTAMSEKVALVSATFARQAFGAVDAVGRRLSYHGVRSIVGVVTDIAIEPQPGGERVIYVPIIQEPSAHLSMLLGVGQGDRRLTNVIDRLGAIDPNQPIDRIEPLDAVLDLEYKRQMTYASTSVILATGAVLLGILGIYLLIRAEVASRRRETAVKLALGATDIGVALAQTLASVKPWGVAMLLAAPGLSLIFHVIQPAVEPLTLPSLPSALEMVAALGTIGMLLAATEARRTARGIGRANLAATLRSV